MQRPGHPGALGAAVAHTGEVIGTTSYYALDETNRVVAIGYTMLARPWWRTGVNTEAKLLLLPARLRGPGRGAGRVAHRPAQRALAAGHRAARRDPRGRAAPAPAAADGTWRDTVQYSMTDDEWPNAQPRLREVLRPPAPVR